ncbi:phosphotransferase [Actinokineospora diospyrosa]|uniref:phosphotransferase n=1 Tax=Actinokineospora diospyrosa TaxID=103728 RepID=UPI0020A3EE4B|nr:aminoglycoside phosphotransferase family protein [Actinokineospora diospyrosa]
MSDHASEGSECFSPQVTRAILDAACTKAGLNSTGATRIRTGENALYRLANKPIIVRIARSMDYWNEAVNEVHVAQWLASADYPGATVVPDLGQPIEALGHPVTLWLLIPGADAKPQDITRLARLLRQLHSLSPPSDFTLPAYDFTERVIRRLETSLAADNDKSYLLAKFKELDEEVNRLVFPLDKAPVHGDAHIKNVMVIGYNPVLIDFEHVGFGQPEWDLAMTATEYVTARWWLDQQYAAFARTYGFDVTTWSGFDVLRQVHEIKMTTWLMQNISQSREIAEEFAARMQSIRLQQPGPRWKPF